MSKLVALVDIGSNAVRFVTARIRPGKDFRILSQGRVLTRLGSGQPDRLDRTAVQATLEAIHGFLVDVRPQNPRIISVATAAVREARNQESLLTPLRRDEDLQVHILSGEEEARLGALTALHELPLRAGLIIDLGGGSLQLTQVKRGAITWAASFPLGVVRTTTRFFKHDPPQPREIRALRTAVRTQLADALQPAQPGEEQLELVGLGGTIRTLARMHKAKRRGKPLSQQISRSGRRLARSGLVSFFERLEPLPVHQRCIPGLKAERADIILAGLITIEEVMTLAGCSSLIALPQGGVRYGILLQETFRKGHSYG